MWIDAKILSLLITPLQNVTIINTLTPASVYVLPF
jgi:hypothetical protein